MPTTLHDLDQYFEPGLTLTVQGHQYTVPLPSAELGLWCQRVATAAGAINAASSDAEIQAAVAQVEKLPELDGDLTLAQRMLGPAYDQMVAARVPHPYLEFCGATAYVWTVAGEEAAERFWIAGGRPEALRPTPNNRAERRAAQQRKTGGTRTAAETATPKAGSTSGTTSPPTSPSSGKRKRRGGRSRGKPSSPTGPL